MKGREQARADGWGPGLFFVFEGIDGAGKTTQAFRLQDRLEAAGREALYVKEPTSGFWGQKIRRIAESGREGISPDEELDYFIHDRREDVERNIAPALARGAVVIADRYFYSTIAYQSVLGVSPEEIRRRNLDFPVPRLVFLLEIPPELSQVRITRHRGEKANQGYEQLDFLRRVASVFDGLDDPNLVRLPGDLGEDEVADLVWKKVEPLL